MPSPDAARRLERRDECVGLIQAAFREGTSQEVYDALRELEALAQQHGAESPAAATVHSLQTPRNRCAACGEEGETVNEIAHAPDCEWVEEQWERYETAREEAERYCS